jgi:hypothetical protein
VILKGGEGKAWFAETSVSHGPKERVDSQIELSGETVVDDNGGYRRERCSIFETAQTRNPER